MIVVADTSPLVVLINIGSIDLLPTLYGRVLIPPEVATELGSPKRPQAVQAFIASPPPWLEQQLPSTIEAIPDLDPGESAAISLARELRADLLIIDEAPGRKAAIERSLRAIGTIGVLVAAAERGLIDLGQAFDKVERTDFWVSRKFLDEQLALFREREQSQEQAPKAQEQQPPELPLSEHEQGRKVQSPDEPPPSSDPKPGQQIRRGFRRGM